VLPAAYAEPALRQGRFNEHYQFLRKGYFYLDKDSSEDKMVFNRTATLRDTWEKEKKKPTQ
jgi:glutaminyl-tRNA synthetase